MKKKIMDNIFLKKKNEFIFFDFFFWVTLGIIFPAVTGNFSFVNIVLIFIYLSAVYYVGERLMSKIDVLYNIPFLFKSGMYIITGGIVCGFVDLFLPYNIILYTAALLFLMDLLLSKRIIFSFSYYDFLCLIPFFVILFQTYELAYGTSERFSHRDGDYYYYTAIVESLKSNHSPTNAIYHIGLSVNYSWAPFLAPAQLAGFSGIPAQFALWGVYSKILPIVCLGTIAYTIVKLYEVLFIVKLNRISIIKYQLFAAFMFLLLGPLHFPNLLKFNFQHTLFLGEGYVLPTGSPGFALSMFLSTLILLLVFSKPSYSLVHKFAIIAFLCIITASKLALFIPLAVMLGSLSLIWLIKKRHDLFITLLVALPFCLWIYKLTVSAKDAATAIELTKDGYYTRFFGGLADKYEISGSSAKKLFVMLGLSVGMWLSIKLLIFLLSGPGLAKDNPKFIFFIIAGLISFVISMLPGFFIDFHSIGPEAQSTMNYNIDMTQFVRGSIFLLTIITMILALYLVNMHPNYFIRAASLSLFFLWMLIIFYSFFANDFKKAPVLDQTWYNEVRSDFFKQKPSLMAMIGSPDYSGQVLASAGVHPWFCTGKPDDKEGFIFTLKGINRNILFQKIFDTTLFLSTRKAVGNSIKKQGVDCIVGSPFTLSKLQFAEQDSLVSRIVGTKWFYRIN